MRISARRKKEIQLSSILCGIFVVTFIVLISLYLDTLDSLTQPPQTYAEEQVKGVRVRRDPTASPTTVLTLTKTPIPTKTSKRKVSPTSTPATVSATSDTTSAKIEPTPTTKPATDQAPSQPSVSASSSDILSALNAYRQSKGIAPLSIDQKLQDFVQGRADYFASRGDMDSHAGFQNMMNDNGFEKMGFNALGENSSFGEWGSAKNLIETIYGNSSAHNESQLKEEWSHVGIGVKNESTDLVFGGRKR